MSKLNRTIQTRFIIKLKKLEFEMPGLKKTDIVRSHLLPPQGALATEEAVIASRIDIGLESRILRFVFVCVVNGVPVRMMFRFF